MKFSELYFSESSELKVKDEVYYKGKPYVVKSIDGDKVELLDTKKTRGTITVNSSDLQAKQMGISDEIGGEREPIHKKRKTRKDAGVKRNIPDDSEQLSLF